LQPVFKHKVHSHLQLHVHLLSLDGQQWQMHLPSAFKHDGVSMLQAHFDLLGFLAVAVTVQAWCSHACQNIKAINPV